MDHASLNRNYERAAWGIFFLWWGISTLLRLPHGSTLLGIGVILLGLNLVRSMKGIPTSGFTIVLGVIALALGVVDLSKALLGLEYDIPLFPILLIVIGLVFLIREGVRMANRGGE